MLRTAAKRGRLMKKCVRRIVEGPVLVLTGDDGVADRAVLHRDFGSRRRIREPVDDDPVARTEARPNDAQASADVADLDLLGCDRAIS
jgi:hypothetical protein